MSKVFYQPDGAWVGDLIPYYENGIYYLFYLHDPRHRENEYAEDTTWHLVTTNDFVHIEDHGVAVPMGTDNEPNRNNFTGSVIKDHDGIYHAFFTAYNEKFTFGGTPKQAVMQAVGKDPYHFETVKDFILNADGQVYAFTDFRDPYVFWNSEANKYWMLLASRNPNASYMRGGCIALCESDDLYHWTYRRPFYDPKMYITMECPELFKMGEWWYLVYSTFNDRFVTHYRKSQKMTGPWIIPEDDAFDCRANYAIKTAGHDDERYAFGWIASKSGNNDLGAWEWGGTMDFNHLIQNSENGDLYVAPTGADEQIYGRTVKTSGKLKYNDAGTVEDAISSNELAAVLYDTPEKNFVLDTEFSCDSSTEFGLALHTDESLSDGYFLRMYPGSRTIVWDMWPKAIVGKYQWQIGGDKPYQIETKRPFVPEQIYQLRVIREGSICEVYLNGKVALSTRLYDHHSKKTGLYLVQGSMKIKKFLFRTQRE